METNRGYGLGDALEAAYDEAMDQWRRQHAAHFKREDLYGGPLINVSQQTIFWSAGRANTTISVGARRKHQTETYFFLLQKRNNVWFFANKEG